MHFFENINISMLINDRGFKSIRSCIQNPYAQLHHFVGVKSAALTFHSTRQTVARPVLESPVLTTFMR